MAGVVDFISQGDKKETRVVENSMELTMNSRVFFSRSKTNIVKCVIMGLIRRREDTDIRDFSIKTVNGWMDGCALRSMGLTPL